MILDDPDDIKVDYDELTRTIDARIELSATFPFEYCMTECMNKALAFERNYVYCMNSGVCRNAVDLFLRSKR